MFNYNTEQEGTGPPKRMLNKRVAFPVSGSTTGPTPGHAGTEYILNNADFVDHNGLMFFFFSFEKACPGIYSVEVVLLRV